MNQLNTSLKLQELSTRFGLLKTREAIYDEICLCITDELPSSKFLVSEIIDNRFGTIKRMIGFDNVITRINDYLGLNLLEMSFDTTDVDRKELEIFETGRLELFKDGIFQLSNYRFPQFICKSIERLINVKFIYYMGFMQEGISYGGVIIMVKQELTPIQIDAIECLINVANARLIEIRNS